MNELLESATDLAKRAGEITLEYFNKSLTVETKKDNSPVTIADRKAEEFLRAEIERRYPDDAILGEEFGEKAGTSGRRWIVDPIDGTKNFIRGVPLYGTLVAIEQGGDSIVGIVHVPPLRETTAAMKGHGCFFNGTRCKVSSTTALAEASVMTTSLENFTKYWNGATLLELIAATGMQRTWGDCYGYTLVATGRADIMVDPIVSSWDIAAMLPIIEESGGRITDDSGGRSVSMRNCIASNGPMHDLLLGLFAKHKRA